MLMVKPGMAYLDIVRDVKNKVWYCVCVCVCVWMRLTD